MVLFADRDFRPRHIFIGQFLGFTGLVAGSLLGAFAALFIPPHWIGLLGALPIALGMRRLLRAQHGGTPLVPANEAAFAYAILDPRTFQVAAITGSLVVLAAARVGRLCAEEVGLLLAARNVVRGR